VATKTATAFISLSCEQFTPSRLERDIPALSGPKIQSTQMSDTTQVHSPCT
jgi:hypothetical protein